MRRLDLGSVHWWDGMVVSQSHFHEAERYQEELLRWLARYGMPLFGILPTPSGDGPALQLEAARGSEGQLRVVLHHCRAVTRDGSWIHIDADSEAQQAQPVVAEIDAGRTAEGRVPVYVSATGEKLPLGKPDSTGNAPRRSPHYQLHLSEEQAPRDGTALKVAEVELGEPQARVGDYLPACVTIDAIDPLRRRADEVRRLAQGALDEVTAVLRASPPAAEVHPWNLAARSALAMIASGWAVAIERLVGWEAAAPPHFVGGLRALLRVFATALEGAVAVREHLDEQFLQTGGLPKRAGGLEFHHNLGRFIASPYVHDAMGRQLREGQQLLEHSAACLRFIGERLTSAGEAPAEAPRPKVTYRQQDYYLLEIGKTDSSFTEESQVLYFRDLGTPVIRSVLFVLRNNAAEGADERDIRLKGGVNDDRPLYCPELQPDFKERPGRIYVLMDVERGKRDSVDYLTLRSSGVVDLEELLRQRETDIRVYYL